MAAGLGNRLGGPRGKLVDHARHVASLAGPKAGPNSGPNIYARLGETSRDTGGQLFA